MCSEPHRALYWTDDIISYFRCRLNHYTNTMKEEDEWKVSGPDSNDGQFGVSGEKRGFGTEEVHCYEVGNVLDCLKAMKSRQLASRDQIQNTRNECNQLRYKLNHMWSQLDMLVKEEHHIDTICDILKHLSMSDCDVSVCKTGMSRKVAKFGENKENGVIDLMSGNDDDDDSDDLFGSDDGKKVNGNSRMMCDIDMTFRRAINGPIRYPSSSVGVRAYEDGEELEYVD